MISKKVKKKNLATENSSLTKKVICFSDVHLGHPRTSTPFIISNIRSNIHYYIEKEKPDVVFIAGDLLDRLLNFPDSHVSNILGWMNDFLLLCLTHNVSIRILEGTPSHDWKQSKIIMDVASRVSQDIDIKYHDTVTVEYIEKLKMNVLFVPDEWGITSSYTLNYVKSLLESSGLVKVDLAIMHGMFDYQVASLPNAPFTKAVHDSQEYLNLVNRYICIGHVHTFSFHDRIIAEGSFDRLAHGEEEAKGFIALHLENNLKDDRFYFIENKGAKIYHSISLKGNDLAKSMKQIDNAIKKLPEDSHIRIIMKKDHPVNSIWDKTYASNMQFNFSKKIIDKAESVTKDEKQTDFSYSGIHIDHTNICDLVKEKLNRNSEIEVKTKTKALELLETFI